MIYHFPKDMPLFEILNYVGAKTKDFQGFKKIFIKDDEVEIEV